MKLAFGSILLACLQFSLVTAGVTIDSNSGTGDRGKVPHGFVTTKGTKFRLDNKDFVCVHGLYPSFLIFSQAFVGSNSYVSK
jgi:hypothetical protein